MGFALILLCNHLSVLILDDVFVWPSILGHSIWSSVAINMINAHKL